MRDRTIMGLVGVGAGVRIQQIIVRLQNNHINVSFTWNHHCLFMSPLLWFFYEWLMYVICLHIFMGDVCLKNTLNLSTKIVVVLCCKMNSRLLVVYLSPSYFCRYRFYMDTSSLFLSLFWLCETRHISSLDLISLAPFSRVLFCPLFLSRVSIRVYDRRSLSPLNANRTRPGSNVKISCVEKRSRCSN